MAADTKNLIGGVQADFCTPDTRKTAYLVIVRDRTFYNPVTTFSRFSNTGLERNVRCTSDVHTRWRNGLTRTLDGDSIHLDADG
jgi:hypothetical protein